MVHILNSAASVVRIGTRFLVVALVLTSATSEAQHSDEFVAHLLDLSPGKVCAAVKRQRESLKNPPKSVPEMLDTLAKQQLPKTVARLNEFQDLL